MYSVSNDFLSVIKSSSRKIKAYFTYEGTKYVPLSVSIDNPIYSNDTFIGTFIAKSGIVKTDPKDGIDLENKSIALYFGVEIEDSIEYVPMGIYHIYDVVNDNEYNIIDSKMKFNIPFQMTNIVYPTDIYSILKEVCRQVKVKLKDTDIPNKFLPVAKEVFFGADVQCCDVINAIAQATCSIAKINRFDELELFWFNDVNFSIDISNESSFPKTLNTYGPINSLVLAREPQNDNVYIQNEESIQKNGLTELRFVNNPLLDIDRYTSRLEVFDRINGFEYIPFSVTSQGFFHLDVGDIISIQQRDRSYMKGYVMNHNLKFSGGVASDFETSALTKNQIDYGKASDTDSKIKRVELIVDKVENEIRAKVEQIGESVYKFETGSWNIFDNCNQAIKKSIEDKSVSFEDMPLGIDKNYIKGRDICISTFIEMTNAVINSGYIGSEFTIGYTDGTKKTYATKIYPGDNLLQYTLSQGQSNISKRIYTHYKLEDKEITSVSNLKIIITCKGELLRISNPKVEFGTYPTGFDYDMQYVRDNITTLNKDYTEIVQTVSTISLQAVSLTEEVTTIKGDVSTVQTRLQSAELKLTPTSITAMVNEKIGVDGKLESTKFVLDKFGVHISGGGLDIVNNSGTKVFYAGVNGDLVINNLTAINGTFTGTVYATSGAFSGTINANNGTIGGWNVYEQGLSNGIIKINRNGVTNIYTWADLAVIQMIILGTISLSGDGVIEHYDFNGDGKVSSADYVILRNRLMAL